MFQLQPTSLLSLFLRGNFVFFKQFINNFKFSHGMEGNQHFKYLLDTKQIFHKVSGLCMDCDLNSNKVFMNPCNIINESQRWEWEHLNEEVLKKWDMES